MELTEFITARLDEDEDAARDRARGNPGPWSAEASQVLDANGNTVVSDEYHWTPMPHIALYDPNRALREIGAKRAHLAAYQRSIDGCLEWYITSTLEEILYSDAAVWNDHRDYSPAWHA